MTIYLFLILLGCAVLLAWGWGGAPERLVAVQFIAAYAATVMVIPAPSEVYRHVEIGVLAVDIALAVGLVLTAVRANRYWTLYVCAFQLIAVLAHLPKLVMPEIVPLAYAVTQMVWSYLMVLVLIVGTIRHRQRQKRFGTYPSWSDSLQPA